MAIDEDGLAYSCLKGLQTRICPIGDMKTQSLLEVWHSERWKEFRDPSVNTVPCRIEDWGKRYPEHIEKRVISIIME